MNRNYLIPITVILISLFVGEAYLRLYYHLAGYYIAANDNELCFKKLKLDHLPSTRWSNGAADFSNFFVNFTRVNYLDLDPIVGLVPKKGFTFDKMTVVNISGIQMKTVFYNERHFNQQGLQNIQEFGLQKQKNVSVRIALFGDSFTCSSETLLLFGMGSLLKELIPRSEVLNFCVTGTGIDTMFARYMHEAKKFKPDVVVFNIFVDDIQRPFWCPVFTPNVSLVDGRAVMGQRKYLGYKDFYEKYELPWIESYLVKHVLWVYNQYTGYSKQMKQGFVLLDGILDTMKADVKSINASFFVATISVPEGGRENKKYYTRLVQLLKNKNVAFLDGHEYFKSEKSAYRNQSFYYIETKDTIGHYSVIGNALHAQGIKELLENSDVTSKSPSYYFANFNQQDVLYLIPKKYDERVKGIKTVPPFEMREINYTNIVLEKEVQIIRAYVSQILGYDVGNPKLIDEAGIQ